VSTKNKQDARFFLKSNAPLSIGIALLLEIIDIGFVEKIPEMSFVR